MGGNADADANKVHWDRLITATLGATVPSAAFFLGRLRGGPLPLSVDIFWGALCVVAWLASIWMTYRSESPYHRYESFFSAMGFPSIILSGTVLATNV